MTHPKEAAMIVPARKQYKVTTEENVPMKTRDGITLYADVVRPVKLSAEC